MKNILLFFCVLIFSVNINAQTNLIDCNNVTYYEDTFYVSLDNNMISNTIYYNDSTSMIYPNHCLVLDDSSLISVSYHTGLFNTGDNCQLLTHLTQNSTRDTLDFDFEVYFNSNNFSNNTIVFADLVLSDVNSTCNNPITIILQSSNSSVITNNNSNSKELLKVTDLFGRETNQTNQPLLYLYNNGTVEKKIILE